MANKMAGWFTQQLCEVELFCNLCGIKSAAYAPFLLRLRLWSGLQAALVWELFGLLLSVWSTFLSATDCPSCFPTIIINLNRQTDDQNCPEIRNSNKRKVVRTSKICILFIITNTINQTKIWHQNLIWLFKHTSLHITLYWHLGVVRLFV